ncbi:uncharacterized protein GGS22DRAFT_165169 [Annulohypoxylon maeteangense]|uniref:uncharacterized protein n=1 Tax=Annulohypoxylon maeteangense TaxID=1927788 RepID=UPI002008DCF2|nr:uncharacterized protein GGS22DRAFT_165169 [Annulohypoxylon maeteangense]KAI0884230.1 hypothetical protein GGS22DRAFT_165169 [Annulohypoxylon maeteangense]
MRTVTASASIFMIFTISFGQSIVEGSISFVLTEQNRSLKEQALDRAKACQAVESVVPRDKENALSNSERPFSFKRIRNPCRSYLELTVGPGLLIRGLTR